MDDKIKYKKQEFFKLLYIKICIRFSKELTGLFLKFEKTFKKTFEEKKRTMIMNLQKLFLNAVVGSSLGLLFCCGGSKQLALAENSEVKEEVNYIPYYLKVYEADSLYLTGNHQRSFEILDSLFKKYEPINLFDEINQYLVSGYEINEIEGKEKYIEILFKEWGVIREDFENYPEIELLCKELNIADLTLNDW